MIDWQTYAEKFYYACQENNFSDEYCKSCLEYAEALHLNGLPIIYDEKHFSLLVGYRLGYIYGVCNKASKFYSSFTIPKRSGGVRFINAPYPSLLEIQRWILDNILYKIPTSIYAKAYKPKLSILDNAKFHRKQKEVVRLDIKDFFPSISVRSVYYIFRNVGYSKKLSGLFAHLCTLNGSLPQGAATSPTLSNIFFNNIDKILGAYARNKNIRYTRYADDMYFSGHSNPSALISFVKHIISRFGLSLNYNKIRTMHSYSRQEVTGIVVNSGLHARRTILRNLIQEAYYINKYGLDSHIFKREIVEANYIYKLLGKAYHIKHINKNTPKIDWVISVLKKAL